MFQLSPTRGCALAFAAAMSLFGRVLVAQPPAPPPSYFGGAASDGSLTAGADTIWSRPAEADFDGDGHADMALLTGGATGSVAVFRGSPDGLLPAVGSPSASWSAGAKVRALDIDADGRPDLLVRRGADDPATWILKGAGDGSFAAPTPGWSQAGPWEVGDFNGDAWPDAAVFDPQAQRVTVVLGSSAGFAPGPFLAAPGNWTSIGAADVDGNGRVDVVLAGANAVAVLRALPAGSFRPPVVTEIGAGLPMYWGSTPSGVPGDGIALGDLDHDGRADLVFFRGVGGGTQLRVMPGMSTGQFDIGTTQPLYLPPGEMRLLDVDGDGNLDVAWPAVPGPFGGAMVFASLGDGRGNLGAPAAASIGPGSFFCAIAPADLDRDGDADLVFASHQGAASTVAAGTFGVLPNRALAGEGARGRAGVPELVAGAAFRGNAAFALTIAGAEPLAPAAIALATDAAAGWEGSGIGLDLRSLIVHPAAPSGVSILLTDLSGAARLALPVPDQPFLEGVVVYAQGLVVDSQGSFALGSASTALTRRRTIIIR